MFRRQTLQGLLLLLLLALAARQELLALVCALVLLTAGLALVWNRWALARVSYERELGQLRAFPGDEVELVLRIENRKPLPLTMLDVRDKIPAGVEVLGPKIYADRDGKHVLQRATSMRWYEGITWRYRVRCDRRGSYRFGPATLAAGDPFGFYQSFKDVPHHTSLVVYPRPLPLDELRLPSRHPLGQLRARQLVADPLRTIGVRDYHPDDPIKDIHWSATARTGTLQTRVYETTTTRELALFLDLDSFEQYWQGIDEQQVERLISATATIVQTGLADGYAVGLYVNGSPAQFEQLVRLPPGRSPAQLERIMDTLARLTPISVTSIAHVLRVSSGDVPWGTTLLLLSGIAPAATCAALARLSGRGRSVAWLYLGDGPPPRMPGVLVHHAPPVQDWRPRRAGSMTGVTR